MMPVTIYNVRPQNQNTKFKQKPFKQKSFDDFNNVASSLLAGQAMVHIC